MRRGRGHSPSAPALAPAGPVRGNPLASPGRGRGGEGSGPAHYAKRRAPPPPPRGKGKRVRFSRRRGASMSARQARPLRRRPGPARPSFNFTSGFGAKAASKRVPCLRRAAPGAEGRARGARAPGVGGWREPGGRGLAEQRARDETSRWERGGGDGPGGAAGVAEKGGFVIVFVSERSEFVTPVPPPPPPARW